MNSRTVGSSGRLAVLVMALVVLGLSALNGSTLTTPAPAATAKYYPPLLNYFRITPYNTTLFSIKLDYGGGDFLYYPQISSKTDTVPYVRSYLTLPEGASITKWNVRSMGSEACLKSKPRAISATKWVWPCNRLPYSTAAWFNFTVDWGTATTQCMFVVAHPLYRKRVWRNGHYVRVLRPIPHAPVQTGYNDPYTSCS